MVIGKPWPERIDTNEQPTKPLGPLSDQQRAILFEGFRSVLVR